MAEAFESFTLQTLDRDYVKNHSDNLFFPDKKSIGALLGMTVLNSGLGVFYTAKDDPFQSKGPSIVEAGFYGLLDLLFTGRAIYTLFTWNKYPKERVMLPISLSVAFFLKSVTFFDGNIKEIRLYNTYRNAGYQWPLF
jgi:hypothetical protein